jgi:hypothetical protein
VSSGTARIGDTASCQIQIIRRRDHIYQVSKMHCVRTIVLCVTLMCLFVQVQYASGVKTKTVYAAQTKSGERFFLKKRNDTIWLAKGHYAALSNSTG